MPPSRTRSACASPYLRDLWKKLESKRSFATWAKDKLSDFRNGADYLFDKIVKKSGRQLTDYYVTLDAAKQNALGVRIAISPGSVEKAGVETELCDLGQRQTFGLQE